MSEPRDDVALREAERIREFLEIAVEEHDGHFGKATFVGHWTNLARAALQPSNEEEG